MLQGHGAPTTPAPRPRTPSTLPPTPPPRPSPAKAEWETSVSLLVSAGLAPADADAALQAAWGWRGQGFWRGARKRATPSAPVVAAALAFLQAPLPAAFDDAARVPGAAWGLGLSPEDVASLLGGGRSSFPEAVGLDADAELRRACLDMNAKASPLFSLLLLPFICPSIHSSMHPSTHLPSITCSGKWAPLSSPVPSSAGPRRLVSMLTVWATASESATGAGCAFEVGQLASAGAAGG